MISTPPGSRIPILLNERAREPSRTGALVSLVRLHWFVQARWAIVILAFTVLAIEHLAFPGARRPLGLPLVIVVLAGVNCVWMVYSYFLARRLHLPQRPDTDFSRTALRFANAQVGVDLLILTLILRFTGGVENPMAIFYLFHMAIGSLLLRRWQAVLQGAWAVLLYALLAFGEWSDGLRPHYPFLSSVAGTELHRHGTYVAACVAVLAAGVSGTLFFMLQIAARLDEGERQLHRTMEALETSKLAIADLNRRRSRFMQTAAHQLKSPLTAIQALTSLIRDGVVPPEGLSPTCDRIIERCRMGAAQVVEMLTLARVQEADPRRHHDTIVHVGEVTDEIYNRHLPIAAEKGLKMRRLVLEDQDLRARIDRSDLTDCLTNLLENAIKYTPPPGSVTVSVRRETLASQDPQRGALDFVAVTVADTGIGIDKDSLIGKGGPGSGGSVFDAFRRGGSALAAKIPGTGLGLCIVREVMEQSGGRLRVHSRLGRGSKFSVLIPAAQSASMDRLVRDTQVNEIGVDVQPGGELPGANARHESKNRP